MLAYLDSEDEQENGGNEVDAGIRGVPNFTVQGRRLDGAGDVQEFLDLFIKIKEEKEEKSAARE